jgi:hypothetical protein
MLSSPQYLELCYELWKSGLSYKPQVGLRIGRGFADVGSEEYAVLSEKKAISLLTGTPVELDEFYLNYYFFVPTVDELVRELFRRQVDIQKIEYINQRSWRISVVNVSKQQLTQEDRSLCQCLGLLLLDQLRSANL